MSVSAPAKTNRNTIRPVPKPTRRPIATGAVARRLAAAQGCAFEDIAADLEAADALVVAATIDRRRDEQIRCALRLVRLARHERQNRDAYLVLADGHLCEAIRLDRITDEHERRAEAQVAVSLVAGRAVVAAHEHLLTGCEPS